MEDVLNQKVELLKQAYDKVDFVLRQLHKFEEEEGDEYTVFYYHGKVHKFTNDLVDLQMYLGQMIDNPHWSTTWACKEVHRLSKRVSKLADWVKAAIGTSAIQELICLNFEMPKIQSLDLDYEAMKRETIKKNNEQNK